MTLYAEIALPLPVDKTFSYSVPLPLKKAMCVGARVLVPFGERSLAGFVVSLKRKKPDEAVVLKEITQVLDEEPFFTPRYLSFTRKLAGEYHASWGELLQASVPSSFRVRSRTIMAISEKGREALRGGEISPEERTVLTILKEKPYSSLFVKRKARAKNFPSLLARLKKKGFVLVQKETRKVVRRELKKPKKGQAQLELDFSLDSRLRQIADTIRNNIGEEKAFRPFLLHGQRESREGVYFCLIRETLAKSEKVLYLVPEISLTEALVGKFEKKLGEKAALLHSRLTERQREMEWNKVREGKGEVIVGSRSALLSPVEKLGLIIVDEEQDESYFQAESPSYDARRGAWIRAETEKTVLLYGSETPTVCSFYKAKKGKYLVSLGAPRRRGRVSLVDSRNQKKIVSKRLLEGIEKALAKEEKVLIFLNRRGYAAFLYCGRCGYIPKCHNCDLSLGYHKKDEKLMCHYCRYSIPKMESCPKCRSRLIQKSGAGIEAVEEEVRRSLPQISLSGFDTDTVKGRSEQGRVIEDFRKGKTQALLGTQLLAHQVDLPLVPLIGILNPEATLTLADFRSGEKTFQALARMLRFLWDMEGAEAVIQTSMPGHFCMTAAASGDYLAFAEKEIEFRRLMNYPPFSCMAEIVLQGENLRRLAQGSRKFRSSLLKHGKDVELLGPAVASVSRLRGLFRIQITLKAEDKKTLEVALRESMKGLNLRRSIQVLN